MGGCVDGALDARGSGRPVDGALGSSIIEQYHPGRPKPLDRPNGVRAGDGLPPAPLRVALVEDAERFPHVRVVRDYPVLRQIGEIRHRQYVERQGKAYGSMVLDRQCLIEPSDFASVNIYARDDQGITCAMRVGEVLGDANAHTPLFEQVIRRCGLPIEISLTCTRLVRAPRHSGRHAVHLIRFVRWQTVRAGWRYCIMQTAEKLVPFFRKFDFHETGIWADDPAAGRLQVLVLDTMMRPIQEQESDD
jgi:hypothetical protein